MAEEAKKSPIRVPDLPEVFVSNKSMTSAVSKAVRSRRLRKIGSRLYTKNKTEAPEVIVKRNWHVLLKEYFPDALITDRTAIENRPAADGSVFIISAKARDVVLPGIKFRPRHGPPPLPEDSLFLGNLHLCSAPRAWLENMRESRSRGGAIARTLSQPEIEERLEGLLRRGGEAALNKLRDEAREVAKSLHMEVEFQRFEMIVGALLRTREVKLKSAVGKARKMGMPYDPDRLEMFTELFGELRGTAPFVRSCEELNDRANANLAFFEAYFSNYIEGTRFPIEEAVDIVFHGVIPRERPKDAHEVLGTFRIVADHTRLARIPRDFEEFIALLKTRHEALMEMRPETGPGQFKVKPNQAGNTLFVAPDLVMGTLAKGYEIYRAIDSALHRAIFMMFLVSEVHPFSDGNGRLARIMMNAELVAEAEQRIIIPTVYRNTYLSALKALSQTGKCTPLVRVLDFAQKYTASIPWSEFEDAHLALRATNAFMDANEAEDNGIRLVLPKHSQ